MGLNERMAAEAEALAAIRYLASRSGHRLTADEESALAIQVDGSELTWVGGIRLRPDGEWSFVDGVACPRLTVDQQTTVGYVLAVGFSGFFDAAADGVALAPVGRIAECYGASLEDNYPEAGPAFLKFATTYWTLKLLTRQADLQGSQRMTRHIMTRINDLIGPLYFPFDGPFQIPAEHRERDIALSLRAFGKKIDAKDFLTNNPILIRQLGPGGPGDNRQSLRVRWSWIGAAAAVSMAVLTVVIARPSMVGLSVLVCWTFLGAVGSFNAARSGALDTPTLPTKLGLWEYLRFGGLILMGCFVLVNLVSGQWWSAIGIPAFFFSGVVIGIVLGNIPAPARSSSRL